MLSRETNGQRDRTGGQRSFAGCFDTGVFDDVLIEDAITEFSVTLTRLEAQIGLSELKVSWRFCYIYL